MKYNKKWSPWKAADGYNIQPLSVISFKLQTAREQMKLGMTLGVNICELDGAP